MSIPKEIERKFIIEKPDVLDMMRFTEYRATPITQIYLEATSHITHRIRARVFGEETVYTETKKIRIDRSSSYEDEHKISEMEFLSLKKGILKGTRELSKVRHSFSYEGHILEIDFYPEWGKTAILEVELAEANEEIKYPALIKIIREVTGVWEYTNAAFSREMPREDEIQ